MKRWILAAVAALAVGQAEAVPVKFTYRLDDTNFDFQWFTVDYTPGTSMNYVFVEPPDEFENTMQFGGAGSEMPILWGTSSIDEAGNGYLYIEWDDGLMTGHGETEAYFSGPLVNGATFRGGYTEWSAIWVGLGDLLESDPIDKMGSWTVDIGTTVPSPVPLPATAPMLAGAVGLLGLRRIRRS